MADQRKQVLCIEDNPVNMLLVSRIVEAEGHELVKAEDGPTAVRVLMDEGLEPDIILLDINLPGIDGLELAKRFKADERLAHIPPDCHHRPGACWRSRTVSGSWL